MTEVADSQLVTHACAGAPQFTETCADRAQLVCQRPHACIVRTRTGELPQTTHHASGRLVPINVELAGGGVYKAPAQEVLSRCELWRQGAGKRICHQHIQVLVGHEGWHQELVDYFC